MPTKSTRNILENGRAEFAYEKALAIANQGKSGNFSKATEYKALTKKLPMLIKTNGLGATLAFIKSKAKSNNEHGKMYTHIGEWLSSPNSLLPNPKGELVEYIIKIPSDEYRAYTVEIMAFMNWLKRFADGLIEEKKKS